ncbi:Sieve element occlusion, N-terminal, partial [Parasponia andersonii]
GSNFHFEYIEYRTPKSNLSVPLCTLRLIGRELSCKASGEKIAHETTLAILHKLSSYTWKAKAVLTLAALALEFGDICLLAQLYPSDPLANQLATLKRVPVFVKPTQLQKRRQALLELTSLIKTTMEVIAIFDEFEKLSLYDSKDIPGLSKALDHMPVDVYWAILTIAACATKVTILMSDEPDKPHDLSSYTQKINYILNRLTVRLTVCRRELGLPYKVIHMNMHH